MYTESLIYLIVHVDFLMYREIGLELQANSDLLLEWMPVWSCIQAMQIGCLHQDIIYKLGELTFPKWGIHCAYGKHTYIGVESFPIWIPMFWHLQSWNVWLQVCVVIFLRKLHDSSKSNNNFLFATALKSFYLKWQHATVRTHLKFWTVILKYTEQSQSEKKK